MNVKEITQRLYAIGTAILEKTGDKPWIDPSVSIRDDKCTIALYMTKGNDRYHIFHYAKVTRLKLRFPMRTLRLPRSPTWNWPSFITTWSASLTALTRQQRMASPMNTSPRYA